MHTLQAFSGESSQHSIHLSRVSIDCFTQVFSEPLSDLSFAPHHLIFDELAAGLLDEREVARLEVLAVQNDDINMLLEAFMPLGDDFKENITELVLDSWPL